MEQTLTTPGVASLFDKATNTITHIVSDEATKRAAIIDSVMDYDPVRGALSHESAEKIIEHVRTNGLTVDWILETHIHADHLSAAPYLQEVLGGKLGIGERILEVQETFGKVFNAGTRFARDGRQFDRLFKDGDEFMLGEIPVRVIATPGHTPADVSYLIGDAVFIGDTLFAPDYGTARCDFPGGSAKALYESVHKLFALPDETRMFLCHDYLPEGRSSFVYETTVGQQKASNVQLSARVEEANFVSAREAKDKTLGMPRLIIPSLQVNMRAGNLPEPEDNGTQYLKVPLNNVFAKKA